MFFSQKKGCNRKGRFHRRKVERLTAMCWCKLICFFSRRRIGRTPRQHGGQPKLFGGSLEEYLEETNQDIPTIIKSCVRLINLYGLHHHGIFRVSGSQVRICVSYVRICVSNVRICVSYLCEHS